MRQTRAAQKGPMLAAFVLPNMGGGGAERLTIDLMAGFLERGARVDLVLLERSGELLDMIPEGARVIDLGAARMRSAIAPLRAYLSRERPDALLAAMWPLTTLTQIAALGLRHKPRIVLSEHCALREQYAGQRGTLAAMQLSMRAYRWTDGVVAVSAALGVEIATLSGLGTDRVRTIHNPIDPPLRSQPLGPAPWGDRKGKRILAIGKLKPQKNFALLINAFARISSSLEATLAIVGEGALRHQLEAQVARLGLQDRVLMPGFSTTPGDWYAGADVFVLPSDYEGFGNVLVEAMHCGLSVVATDCPYGPAEVLGSGEWGTLVPRGDVPALAAAIQAALGSPNDPERQRARAAEFAAERAVEAYWQTLFG